MESKYKNTVAVNTEELKAEEISVCDHEQEAVRCLKERFVTENASGGLLALPLGKIKNVPTTYFLVREMISKGYQVVWLTDSNALVENAAEYFYSFAKLAKFEKPKIKKYRISCVSDEHLKINCVKDSEIIIANIRSVCKNKQYLRRILGNNVFIVIEEANRAFVPTFRETVKFITKTVKNFKYLGITSKPLHVNDTENTMMLRYYGKLIYALESNTLPSCESINTNCLFETEKEEKSFIKTYGKISVSLAERIASDASRNETVVNTYTENKEKYGKTVIYASNSAHCEKLYGMLTEKGTVCGKVYRGVNEVPVDAEVIVSADTSVNADGFKTAFITFPTKNRNKLLNFIAEKEIIVEFCDKWGSDINWITAEKLISEYNVENCSEKDKAEFEQSELEIFKDDYFETVAEYEKCGKTVSIPAARYILIDKDGGLHRMSVYEDQMHGFLAMKKDKNSWLSNMSVNVSEIINKYFSYPCIRPLEYDIELYIENMRTREDPPMAQITENRKQFDPVCVEICDAEAAFEASQTAKDLFGTLENYIKAVEKAERYRRSNAVAGVKSLSAVSTDKQ